MIAELFEEIPADNHLYRTGKSDGIGDMMKQIRANEWKAKV
jgi:hypothetical protein